LLAAGPAGKNGENASHMRPADAARHLRRRDLQPRGFLTPHFIFRTLVFESDFPNQK
jgi:hypothetical protein